MNPALRDALKLRNAMRQICRTDLLKLCEVLGYKDVSVKVHGPILDAVQKFQGGRDVETAAGVWEYKAFVPHWKLKGRRQNLFLYPRGHLKTSIVSIAHTIQWIINYPNIRVMISCATGDQVDTVMGGLLNQFRYNPYLRALFPEYCPPADKAADWGSRDRFSVPCRTDYTLKEGTVRSCTIGKVVAGGRADVIKNSDLVDEQNVKTPGGIKEVISHFGHMEPLLERYNAADGLPSSVGWNDVEGTRYDFGDLYGQLIKSSDWFVVLRSAIKEDGRPLWEERFSLEELERIRRQPHVGDWIFAAQYLNKCVPSQDGLCSASDVVFIPSKIINDILPRLRVHCTIDAAGMDPMKRGDNTAITVGGFDGDGRLYVLEIHAKRFTPEEIVDLIFDIYRRYPKIIDFKIEAEIHACTLLPHFTREMSKKQKYPPIYTIKRDTQVSKQNRIRGLRPWFKNQNIRFNQDIHTQVKMMLLEEIEQFPSQSSGVHDDILDTLADMMQDQEGGITSDIVADAPDVKFAFFGVQRPPDKFMGFGENGVAQWLYGNDEQESLERSKMTGFLN